MKINKIEILLGSGFYTGYMPFASGTFGSLAALFIYLIPGFNIPLVIITFSALFFVLGVKIGSKFETLYGKDPAQCTIDEIVGMWITLMFVPKNIFYLIAAFILWRLMDIVKPFPARQLEKFKGGWGIMMDDVAAALYSLVLTHLLIYFF